MTRKITTAAELDALPWGAVVLGKEARGAYQRGTGGWWVAGTGLFPFTSGELVEFEAFDLVHDPSAPAPAPAPSVVPEAAVEAAALAARKERAFSAAAAFGVPIDDVPYCAEMIARAALTAALLFLTAVPSATRDEVARALEGEFGCFLARDPHMPDAFWGGAADALLARFNITPKEDR